MLPMGAISCPGALRLRASPVLLPGQGYLVLGECSLSKEPGFNCVSYPTEVGTVLRSVKVEMIEEKSIAFIENGFEWTVLLKLSRQLVADRPVKLGAV